MTVLNDEHTGVKGIWIPEATVSFPDGGKCRPRHMGIVVASQKRMKAQEQFTNMDEQHPEQYPGGIEGYWRQFWAKLKGQFSPEDLKPRLIWSSVSHNERVDRGASIQFNRVLATATTTSASGVFTAIGIASNTSATPIAGYLSIGTTTEFVQTNEFTTIGLGSATTRITTGNTSAGYAAPASLNATASGTVTQSYTSTGAGTANGAALFDSATVASGHMYASVNFTEGSAVVANTDTLAVTWTITM